MAQGYDQFFKNARKANENGLGHPKKGGGSRPRFQVEPGSKNSSPEDRIKKVLSAKVREKRRAKKASRSVPFPKAPLVTVALAVGLASAATMNPEALEWVLGRLEIGVFGEANASDTKDQAKEPANRSKEENPADAKIAEGEKTAGNGAAKKDDAMPDTRSWSPEEVSFFNKLGERKRELDLREAELNKLEEELQKQRVELDEKLKRLEATRGQIAKALKTRVDDDQTKVNKLVEVYSGMKPAQAAKVIETINEGLAVQVLDRMKKKSASDILNVMNAEKAQRLSEMLAGYKKVN